MSKLDDLSRLIAGRNTNLFQDDINSFHDKLESVISGSRILVIGGAGSIGSSTVQLICNYNPKHICIVDTNENNLTELTRIVRNNFIADFDFLTLPISFGSSHMEKFINDNEPYDFVLNFAALKHVRSEKNVISILQMLQTNAADVLKCLKWLVAKKNDFTFFNVSTDKAANPVNVLGASKQIMENLIFSFNEEFNSKIKFISSRFANVAASDGSLFHSYINRLDNKDLLPVPGATKRFFISLEEAGTICMLSAFCGENNQIYIPKLHKDSDLQLLDKVAEKAIHFFGFKAKRYYSEVEAVANLKSDLQNGNYPLLVTMLDTIGEKDFEEFENDDEIPVECNFKLLAKIGFVNRSIDIFTVFAELEKYNSQISVIDKSDDLMQIIRKGTFNFQHKYSALSLDNRR
jgi:FlaA1/EpsC-like NDP-sugar epimerase